jgi:hypothetical protein
MFFQMLLFKIAAISMLFPFFNFNFFSTQENTKFDLLNPEGVCERQAFTGSRVTKTFAPSINSLSADFNNDGKPDIVNFHSTRATLTVQLNIGNGYFSEPQIISSQGEFGGFRFTTGDFNNDGFEDLLTATRLLFGDGTGGFAAPQTTSINPNTFTLLAGDFNGDDNLDVAGFDGFSGPLIAYLGDGFGGFTTSGSQTINGSSNYIEAADVNNDGISDLVIVLSNANTVSIILGNEEGTFEDQIDYPLGGEGSVSTAAIGDIDGNGTPDILAASNSFGGGDTFAVVLLNDGNGVFTVQPRFTEPTGNIRRIDLLDINSDGKLDYIAAFASSFFVRFGNGDGTFQESKKSAVIFGETELLFEDFTGDGIRDLGFGSSEVDAFTVLVNDENGNLGAKQFPVTGYSPNIDINQNFDLFLRDLRINRTFVASVNQVGTSVGNAPTTIGNLSANGNVVAFESYSTNIVPIDNPNMANDVFAFTKAIPKVPISDFDADGKTDLSVFRPSNTVWYILNSQNRSFRAQQFGNSTDIPVADDFDGDGRTDISVFRSGVWYIFYSSTNNFGVFSFGEPGDKPVNADYDGDIKADLAVFRPSTNQWFIKESTNPTITRIVQFGMSNDALVPDDFDGDGKADIAVFRDGVWYILQSSNGNNRTEQFGAVGDKPVQGDFDGDGLADLAVFRPSDGIWYVRRSDNSGFIITQFGIGTDIPLRGDFDGDGKADIAVFRDGVWYILQSSDGNARIEQFGIVNDLPIPR